MDATYIAFGHCIGPTPVCGYGFDLFCQDVREVNGTELLPRVVVLDIPLRAVLACEKGGMGAALSAVLLTPVKLLATYNFPQHADWELLADAQLAISHRATQTRG